jgi:hypothetical protein
MIRLGLSICFALTLLCPVFCLAETDAECSAHASLDGENCEAMAIGAVVEKSDFGLASPQQLFPSFDGFLPLESFACGSDCQSQFARRYGLHSKPPPTAARRHALLQTFLF